MLGVPSDPGAGPENRGGFQGTIQHTAVAAKRWRFQTCGAESVDATASMPETTASQMPLPPYELCLPETVRFGAGRVDELGELARCLGGEAWLVDAPSVERTGLLPRLVRSLAAAGLPTTSIARSAGEPTVAQVAEALVRLPRRPCRPVVVAVGGGSTLDLAKAIAALAANTPPDSPAMSDHAAAQTLVISFLEGVGDGRSLTAASLPVIAVPTTGGTGTEATRNAVLSCPQRRFKKSLRSPFMVPRGVILDPQLALSCSRSTTASTGLDCITQLIESYTSRFAKPIPRAIAIDALPRAMSALPRALARGDDLDARASLCHAAFTSGLALGNSGLGMAHGVAAALGVECGTPHGVACAVMLPVALRVNLPLCLADYATLGRAVLPACPADDTAAAAGFVAAVERLCTIADTPRQLSALGLARDRLSWLAENAFGASMRGNPVAFTPDTLLPVLERCY